MEKKQLINNLIAQGYLKTDKVIQAFRKVRREDFVPVKFIDKAYIDYPLPIGHSATISQPLTVAHMTESLDVKNKQKILEIGAGSGYQAAILSLLNPNGEIYTTEIIPKLAEMAKKNLVEFKNVAIIRTNGYYGYEEKAPYDRIIATCYVASIPEHWEEQLVEGGKIVAPVGGAYFQNLMLFTKIKGKLVQEDLRFPCAFVPLRH